MGKGCPPPVYVRVRRYGWRRREHAWTGGRVHRGPGAIATMMHAAARFKAASRRSRGIIAAGGKRSSQASLDERHLCDAAVSGTPCPSEIEIGRPELPPGVALRSRNSPL